MNDATDRQLLLDYAARRDEAAFAEVVRRYGDLVYSAARRQVSDADAAEVAQGVFVDLAAKVESVAARLSPEASLAGWLHRATRFAALNQLRAAHRRAANETQAMQHLSLVNDDSGPDWASIQPVLDEAIDHLADDDREALLLRFFQGRDFRAVGRALGVSDDTAQKRVSRALERLRGFLVRHGVTVSATALAVVLADHAVGAAPAGFAVSIAAGAKAVTAVSVTSTSAVTTAKSILAMTTLQKGLAVAALAAAAVVGVTVYQGRETIAPSVASAPSATQPVPPPKAPTADQIAQLNARIESLAGALEQAQKSNQRTIAERDGALRAAAIYRELAERKDKGAEGEVTVPSHRHFMQGIGQIAAYFATANQLDQSLLTEDERLAVSEGQIKMGLSMLKLYRAAKTGGMVSDDPAAPSNRDQPDNTTCFITGALDLTQDQFAQVYSLVSRYNVPALPVLPETAEITAERMVVVKQRRAELDREIGAVLKPEQLARFQALKDDFHIINPYDGSVRLGYSGPKN